MKKLLKIEICGSVNSVQCALIGWKLFDKSNFAATVYAQCMNSICNGKFVPKRMKKKKKKEQKNADANTNAKPKRSLRDLVHFYFSSFQQPRRGCFEIREKGGETFISLLVNNTNICVFFFFFSLCWPLDALCMSNLVFPSMLFLRWLLM